MAKLIVEIPDGTHMALKQRAFEEQRTLRAIVNELVDQYLGQQRSVHRDLPTGLCDAAGHPLPVYQTPYQFERTNFGTQMGRDDLEASGSAQPVTI